MSSADITSLNGSQKTAILLLSLGEQFASEVFKRMDKKELTAVSKAMVELGTVPKETVEAVLRDYYQSMISGRESIRGGQEAVKRLLLPNLDSETAKYVSDVLNLESGPVPFDEIGKVSPKLLAQILRNEHPQTLALIVGNLPADSGAELLTSLPAGVRTEILLRLANLESVPEEMLMAVDKVLQRQIIAMGGKEGKKVGGVHAVAEILNAVDRATEEEVLSEIEEESPGMSDEIRNLMFVFEDVKNLDDRSVRELLKEISNEDLSMALRGAKDDLRELFFKNMSERAANMIREDLEVMGPTRLSEVEAAQQNVVKIVRRLENEGRVVVSRGSGDLFV